MTAIARALIFIVAYAGIALGRLPGLRLDRAIPTSLLRERMRRALHAPAWHFFKKLFFAAPANGFPSALTAFGSHASRLHFLTNAVLAAPASGFPSLLTA